MTRILTAEDDKYLQRVICLWLERHGYSVRRAGDGKTALRIHNDWHPDILITDVNMPEMDGVTLARTILGDRRSRTGIIILSCRVDMVGIGCELGDERVIHHAKPFSPSRLIEEVEMLSRKLKALSKRRESETVTTHWSES